jgi:hypothetical protein
MSTIKKVAKTTLHSSELREVPLLNIIGVISPEINKLCTLEITNIERTTRKEK